MRTEAKPPELAEETLPEKTACLLFGRRARLDWDVPPITTSSREPHCRLVPCSHLSFYLLSQESCSFKAGVDKMQGRTILHGKKILSVQLSTVYVTSSMQKGSINGSLEQDPHISKCVFKGEHAWHHVCFLHPYGCGSNMSHLPHRSLGVKDGDAAAL
jgi:hypothetical protein